MKIENIVFLGGKRTAFGAFGGALREISATDLGVHAAKAALQHAAVKPEDINHVVFGNVLQTSSDAVYLARHVGLKAGVPVPVPAVTVNRLCGSGFEAIVQGARLLLMQEADFVLVGGTESMSQAPHIIRGARWGLRLNSGKLEDYLWEALLDPNCGFTMAQTAENLAEKYGITRAATDEYAQLSQSRAKAAWDSGKMAEEVAAMTDYRFYEQFGTEFFQQFGEKEWDVMDEFGKAVRPQGHKIGGGVAPQHALAGVQERALGARQQFAGQR